MDVQPQPDPAPLSETTGSRAVAAYADEARRLVLARYPEALGATLGGSSACGRATPGSDLDIAVLLADGGTSRREVFRHEGRLAEVFLHTRAEAQALLAAGPAPLTPDESEFGRFLLTDLLDDLAENGPGTDRHEQLAIADRTLREAAHLLTAHHRA